MLKEEWDEILNRFESSGLTQKAFCKTNNLQLNPFQYRWNARNRLKRKKRTAEFELISVVSSPLPIELKNEYTLSIHLPNKIRCDVPIAKKELKAFIGELASLC